MRLQLTSLGLLSALFAAFGLPAQAGMTMTHNHSPQLAARSVTSTAQSAVSGVLQRWSDPATWGGVLPQAGSVVTIPAGQTVLLDISPPALKSLTVQGQLTFDKRDLNLTSDWIMVMGSGSELRIGTEQAPYRNRAVITLTGNDTTVNVMGMGNKFLGAMGGGLINIHGVTKTSWARLNSNAAIGSRQISLDRGVNWQPGDRIVLASTNFNPYEAEVTTITGINKSRTNATLNLATPLTYLHWGQNQTYGGRTLDERAEVGLLNRNILIQGDSTSVDNGFGGHLMVMVGSKAYVEGAEFFHMGQQGRVGRYPFHWHLLGDGGAGQYIKNSSIHDTFNRCVTIHGTNNALVQGNVAYSANGHCYFLEDANETGNTFDGNLGLLTKRSVAPIIESDQFAATYWISNPNNKFTNNVAAGSDDLGFWYDPPLHPTGLSANPNIFPRQAPFGGFDGNVAHSTLGGTFSAIGVWVSNVEVPATFTNITSYKNVNRAIYLGCCNHTAINSVTADSPTNYYGWNATYQGGLAVGLSANQDDLSVFTTLSYNGGVIRGVEEYDGWIRTEDTTFVNFTGPGSSTGNYAPWGGVATTSQAHSQSNPGTWFKNLRLINSRPAYYPDITNPATQTATYLTEDRDGSLSGTGNPGFVVWNRNILLDAGCTPLQSSNLLANISACPYRYGFVYWYLGEGSTEPPLGTIQLKRDDGVKGLITSSDFAGPRLSFSMLMVNREYEITFSGTIPSVAQLALNTSAPTDSIIMHLKPGVQSYGYIAGQYPVYLNPSPSLNALRSSQTRTWYQDPATKDVWIKVFSSMPENPEGISDANASVYICRNQGCLPN
ncbi:G8 domain-containing protein [Anthocerotibacter panamensis]|uniref:G8 domain-containing protein n=1 Tax=Anthocerotibacter panamensis TaxID=2857077 RepID=UPI001C4022FC|nr:G8 domain-containing protein [Anthocerotibacter panamensis]